MRLPFESIWVRMLFVAPIILVALVAFCVLLPLNMVVGIVRALALSVMKLAIVLIDLIDHNL